MENWVGLLQIAAIVAGIITIFSTTSGMKGSGRFGVATVIAVIDGVIVIFMEQIIAVVVSVFILGLVLLVLVSGVAH